MDHLDLSDLDLASELWFCDVGLDLASKNKMKMRFGTSRRLDSGSGLVLGLD